MVEADRGNERLSDEYYFRSLGYSKKAKSKIHLSHAYANLGIMKFNSSDFDSSLYYFKASLDLREKLNHPKGIVEGYNNIGFFYFSTNEYDKAVDYLIKTREMANKYGFISDELDAISNLADIYLEKGDTARYNVLLNEKSELENQMKKQEGIDDEIIESIDLTFKKKDEEEEGTESFGIGWKELTITILIAALIIFFISERKRVS